jgi:ATP-binding cassette subfamily B protein
MSKTGVSVGRIREILDAEPESDAADATRPPMNVDVVFDDVSFAYNGHEVLHNLSFRIPRGSTFGILGPTASGKSTITYLLNGLYDLDEGSGRIYYGDTEIRKIEKAYLRANVGLVLQEPFLFSKTIRENIAIGYPDASEDEIRRAARVAAIDESIDSFSNGYSTIVGERGVTLSGGQKQRVAMARTLLLNTPVIIFDDSMSAVDLETDRLIRLALKEEVGEATVIVISHRINTLMDADVILVIENGRLADLGSHEELIGREGTYRRIYEMQSGEANE